MLKRLRTVPRSLAVLLSVAMVTGCSQAPKPAAETKPTTRKIPAGQEFSGFMKDYGALKPNPKLEGNALTYASTDAQKNLRSYFAIVVDPIDVYIATDADEAASRHLAEASGQYFHHAWSGRIEAFPVSRSRRCARLRAPDRR